MAKCCMCEKSIERDDAPVLAMGAAGNPRFLCDECAALLDIATTGRDITEIGDAMEKIGLYMADGNPDGVTYSIVSQLMVEASDRAKAIKDGSYDFSLDEEKKDDGGLDEIPEELLESDEDKEADRVEEEKNKKFDKVYNIILFSVLGVTALLLIWKLIENFFLK